MLGWRGSKRQLSRQLHTLNEQIDALSREVARLADDRQQHASVTIEHLEVEQAYLDELVFRLDSLDIEELSGSLNLGNNFHPKVTHTSVKRPATMAGASSSAAAAAASADGSNTPSGANLPAMLTDGRRMNTTTNGYLITLS